ncbi:MAG: SDR family NAD(P)-dependent oxidoreductase [Microbacteriaceae bacterium]
METRREVAIVTGAGGGIGRATCRRLAADGVAIVAVDLFPEAVTALADELRAGGAEIELLIGDVLDEQLPARALELATQRFGTPTILVNNAGMGSEQIPIWEIEPAVWRHDLEVNLTSHFLMCHAIVPAMREAGYGRIVNMASAAGMEGHALAGGYAAAKGGLIAMTKTLGKELAKDGVIVNAIAPALISSPMLEQDWFSEEVKQTLLGRIPMGRLGQPEEVAELIAYLTSDKITFSTGAVYDLSGGRATY